MKRVWIAAGLLLFVFFASLFHSFYVSAFAGGLTSLLEEAEVQAERGDWEGAAELTEAALKKWQSKELYLHVALRHNETDVIYTGLREVAEFIQCEEGGEYSAANARLLANLELMAEAERLTLKNVL